MRMYVCSTNYSEEHMHTTATAAITVVCAYSLVSALVNVLEALKLFTLHCVICGLATVQDILNVFVVY